MDEGWGDLVGRGVGMENAGGFVVAVVEGRFVQGVGPDSVSEFSGQGEEVGFLLVEGDAEDFGGLLWLGWWCWCGRDCRHGVLAVVRQDCDMCIVREKHGVSHVGDHIYIQKLYRIRHVRVIAYQPPG